MSVGRKGERGVAFVESMLIMSFALLLMYSVVQTGLTAYTQVSADGASFVGTHTAVQYQPDGTGNAAQIAAQVANNVFQGIGATTVAILHPTATTFETDVTVPNSSFSLTGSGSSTTSRQVDTSSDPGDTNAPATQFPPNDTTLCVTNKLNAATDTLTTTPIAGYTPGALETTATSSTNSIAGSLSITPGTLQATFGAQETIIDTTTAAQTAVSGDLSQVSNAVNAIEGSQQASGLVSGTVATVNTALKPILTQQIGIPPVPGTDQTVPPTTIVGLLSGLNGDIEQAEDGVLAAPQTALLQTEISAAVKAIDAIPNVSLDPTAQMLVNGLLATSTDIAALDAAEANAAALDATVANQACP